MPGSALPDGDVTFLFTDIEGSTLLIEELGEEGYVEALAVHRRALRGAFAVHGGVEVDTQGDAFLFVFADPGEALAAAADGQAALGSGPIRVRMGLHTGEAYLTGEGYAGRELHRAARIAASGHGGQVVLSAATRSLVDGEMTELGEHRLKDFEEPVGLFQLGSSRFPPLKTISNTNLPRPASSFVGRERERDELVGMLSNGTRLVTLSGPGGSGKTRLAVEAAAELVSEFKAGVFWVGLSALRDPLLVGATISQTVGAKDGLAEHVGERELLLLLDNFEQVVEAAPELSELLESCPNLKLLVTSRELLRIRGEVDYPVPPLAEQEAVELFCERAQLEPDETIAELCRRLDELPLALELAAARTSVLSPAQILERVSQRLDLLKGGRDVEPRQQTLRATIDWSHDLLTVDEQRLFSRLAVFRGGCTLEAAEQVADADLDTLQSLVDKSLLRHTNERFWMLETIREYAREWLARSGEEHDLCLRHATATAKLVEDGSPAISGEDPPPEWVARVSAELDNLRAAIAWAKGAGEDELLAWLVAFAWPLQYPVGSSNEFAQWLEDAIERCPDPARTARLALALAANSYIRGSYERGVRAAEQALELSRGQDGALVVEALDQMAVNCAMLGEHDRAAALLDEALALARAEPPKDERLFLLLVNVSGTALARQDFDRVLGASQEAIELADRLWPDFGGPPVPLVNRGLALLERGDPDAARRCFAASLRTSLRLPLQTGIAYAFLGLAASAAGQGDAVSAAQLAGAADAVADRAGLRFDPYESEVHARTLALARNQLGRQFDDWYTAGRETDPANIAKPTLEATQPG
jgi:predicted ATPase